jgi:hypothetical protein
MSCHTRCIRLELDTCEPTPKPAHSNNDKKWRPTLEWSVAVCGEWTGAICSTKTLVTAYKTTPHGYMASQSRRWQLTWTFGFDKVGNFLPSWRATGNFWLSIIGGVLTSMISVNQFVCWLTWLFISPPPSLTTGSVSHPLLSLITIFYKEFI